MFPHPELMKVGGEIFASPRVDIDQQHPLLMVNNHGDRKSPIPGVVPLINGPNGL